MQQSLTQHKEKGEPMAKRRRDKGDGSITKRKDHT
jgi:hypothetical protein